MEAYSGNKKRTRIIDHKHKENVYFWLLLILIFGFLIRFLILDERWINPDEGAHVIDGRLVLDGLVPKVDYGSRQPFYVYVIAIVLKLFGISYLNARFFLPLISSIGVMLLIFLISKKLFDNKIALLASALYTFLPLSIVESAIVKTEPLTTLLTCISIYFIILGADNQKKSGLFFFLSGVFLSLAFYVRESSLSILLAILLFFIFAYWGAFRMFFRYYAFVLAGYIFICLIAFAFYSQYLTFNQLMESSINPLNIVLKNLDRVSGVIQANEAESEMGSLDFINQPWNESLRYLQLTLFTNSFLFAGLILSIFIFIRSLLNGGPEGGYFRDNIRKFSLLYSWIVSLGLAYAYWTLQRGYFIQYFEEFLPPLSILLAFVIVHSLSVLKLKIGNSKISLTVVVSSIALLLVLVFFLNMWFPKLHLKSAFYWLSAILLSSFFYFLKEHKPRGWLYKLLAIGAVSAFLVVLISFGPLAARVPLYLLLFAAVYFAVFLVVGVERDYNKRLGFIFSSLVLSCFLLSFAVSGRTMGLDFDSVWSPETVREVSDYIKANSTEGDEIMSGGVIWELESNRRPFMNQSHPLVYLFGIPPGELENIEWRLKTDPPKFIVLDGYTEKTYLNHVNKLQVIMDEKYELKKIVEGSRYPVKIYELNRGASG